MEHSQKFLDRHDLLKDQPYAVNCSSVQILDKNLKVKLEFQRPMLMSSWNVLYYRLRANFDGLASSYCTQTPAKPSHIGRAVYDQGKRVNNLYADKQKVQIEVEDLVNRSTSTISADQVIIADGSASQMRHLLQPQLKHSYAGHVAWRGTVMESSVSDETRNTFQNKTTLHATSGGYIALYVVPFAFQAGMRCHRNSAECLVVTLFRARTEALNPESASLTTSGIQIWQLIPLNSSKR